MTRNNAVLSMDVSQPLSYFIGLLKSDEHSGDRCVALHSRHAKEYEAQAASRELYGIDLPPSFAQS